MPLAIDTPDWQTHPAWDGIPRCPT